MHSDLLAEATLDSADSAILLIDGRQRVINYNKQFAELWKIPAALQDESKDKELLAYLQQQSDSPQTLFEEIVNQYRQDTHEDRGKIYLKDGRTFESFASIVCLDDRRTARMLRFRDITILEDSKRALRNETSFRNTIIHGLPNLIWLKDPNGLYLACNQRCEDLFGAVESEIFGKSDFDFIDASLADDFVACDRQAIREGAAVIHDRWVTFANDDHKELLETTRTPLYGEGGELIGVLGVARDITERRASEEKLQISEERFSLAMRGANDGLWDWNLETNEVYYSPRWKSMLGYEEEELDNDLSTWINLVHPDDRDWALDDVQDCLEGRSNSFDAEIRMLHKDGHEVFVLARAFLSKDNSYGKAVRLVGTHVDITERKKSEAFNDKNAEILEMIATGKPASKIYDEIALLYESRHPGMRCSMLELQDGVLLHGGAPSLPKEYCEAVHGLKNGPEVGSCGTSTYTGKCVLVEDIATDPKWQDIKHVALPHGMRSCWSQPIKNSSGMVLGAFGMYYNHPALPTEEELNDLKSAARLAGIVMERDQAQKRIHELAYTDKLTGLASRARFYQILDGALEDSDQGCQRFSLLYVDLDNFKSVNDSLGHDAGDVLLREVAKRLQQVSREQDVVARLSGDEFCIYFHDVEQDSFAEHIAQRCLDAISKPIEISSRKFTPTCSIGIAHYPNDGSDISTLIKAADTSLYAAKELGKNQFAVYTPELTLRAEYRFRVEQYLREAIETQQLSLVYQPQINLETGEVIGVEALSRWNHPQLGPVPPTEFIPTAERIGMINPLTEWVLRTACQQALLWRNEGFPNLQISVNISPKHFLDRGFVSLIRQLIDDTEISPKDLTLEVTESVVQTDIQNLSVFRDLKDIGVLVAIDDFGTGYSSFASLKHLTVDYLKIDRHFINDMQADKKSQVLIRSMIEMAHNLDYEVIAEGVETVEQLRILKDIGGETAQGYLFSKPVVASELSTIMRKQNNEFRSYIELASVAQAV